MELDNIRLLLDRYFEGETTLEEEKTLAAYFASAEVADDLVPYRPMFGYFAEAREMEPERTMALPVKRNRMRWIPAAASVVLLLGAGTFAYFHYEEAPRSQELGTYDDPEVAFQETQKALKMLSHHVNSGVKGMAYIETYEQSKNVIFKK